MNHNQLKIENALTVYGSKVVSEVLELADFIGTESIREVFASMTDAEKHIECADFLFFDEEKNLNENIC